MNPLFGQAVQALVVPVPFSWKKFAAHTQLADPGVDDDPTGQRTQFMAVSLAVVLPYMPAIQTMQLVGSSLPPTVPPYMPMIQARHPLFAVDDVEVYLPAMQSVQMARVTEAAPGIPYVPSGQASPTQSATSSLPGAPTYFPGMQLLHASVAAVEYLPAAHGAHDDAPSSPRVFVVEPGLQAMHATVDADENLPAAHIVHDEAPPWCIVSVVEPTLQLRHSLLPNPAVYMPGGHFTQVDAQNVPGLHLWPAAVQSHTRAVS